MSEREVIVVGAGPAGSTAACALAQRGHDVLLLDREDFPRDKPCGDGIPPGTVDILDGLGMANRIRDAGFHPVYGIRLGSPWGRIWETDFRARRPAAEFYIAPRIAFDSLLREHAVVSGAEFRRAAVKRPLIDDGRVCGVEVSVEGGPGEEIPARAVIAADGATSAVARALRPHKQPAHLRGVAVRAYVDGIETFPNKVEFYFYKRFLPGYGWIFPLGPDRANVGVVVRADRYRRESETLNGLLDDFLERRHVKTRLRPNASLSNKASWQLPFAAPGAIRRGYDGAVLVGDAGSFVDALTGEGIHLALRSAIVAADLVHEALAGGHTALDAFDARCEQALGPLIRRSYQIHRWVACSPVLLEGLFVACNLGRGLVHNWLNRVSTDFVVGPQAVRRALE